ANDEAAGAHPVQTVFPRSRDDPDRNPRALRQLGYTGCGRSRRTRNVIESMISKAMKGEKSTLMKFLDTRRIGETMNSPTFQAKALKPNGSQKLGNQDIAARRNTTSV